MVSPLIATARGVGTCLGDKIDSCLLRWDTGRGLVLIPAELAEDAAEPSMLWLASEASRTRAGEPAG